MATRRTLEYLDGQHVRYVVIHHSPAYTAQEVAASAHVPGKSMAKTVVVNLDGRLALAAVPAHREVGLNLLRSVTGAGCASIAEIAEFADRFEGCQRGTMPPIGHLFGLETYVDQSLSHYDDIAFNAGTTTDVVVMKFSDFRKISHARIADISAPMNPDLDLPRHIAQL